MLQLLQQGYCNINTSEERGVTPVNRKLIITACLVATLCLTLPRQSFADDTSSSSQVIPTEETRTTQSTAESTSNTSHTTSDTTTESTTSDTTASTAESTATNLPEIRSLDGQDDSSYGKFTKGTPVTAEDFRPIIEGIESFKIKNISFIDTPPAMDKAGLTKVNLLIVTDQDETIKYTYTFLTKNNEATIKVTDIKFDSEKNLLSFKTDPSCVAYVTADTDKGTAEIYTHEDGIVARQYKTTPNRIQIIVLDLKGNYSDIIDFDVVANDVSKNETEPEKITSLQDKAEKVKNDRDKLPQTGEAIAKYGLVGGAIILLAIGIIVYKRRN